jgi:hypothetical protein
MDGGLTMPIRLSSLGGTPKGTTAKYEPSSPSIGDYIL